MSKKLAAATALLVLTTACGGPTPQASSTGSPSAAVTSSAPAPRSTTSAPTPSHSPSTAPTPTRRQATTRPTQARTHQPATTSPTPSPTHPPVTAGPTVALSIAYYSFTPMNLTVARGTTIRATNHDNTTHTWTSTGHWDSGDLSPGQSYAFRFNTAGSFSFQCTPHPFMTGSVTVN